ncbi:hypothetical protein [Dietzia maris]|uniref:hypothetical protein n=1 Tax=Dietzia maris TaxID=37915 RepID=UPI00223BB93C|nr:hypothetical protein [Dietzia maris]MCT1434698.1 hypothetical protein [Dietzia maris]MCT1521855.1 hypothetical protein [Dietzia maris]
MTRPSTVTAASWIWLFCGLFSTLTITGVLAATDLLAFVVPLGGTEDASTTAPGVAWIGAIIAMGVVSAIVLQVVAAVKLRDGERWARALLTIAAGLTLVTALWDITLWSAWVLLGAHLVAFVLAYTDSATAYLEVRSPDPAWAPVYA